MPNLTSYCIGISKIDFCRKGLDLNAMQRYLYSYCDETIQRVRFAGRFHCLRGAGYHQRTAHVKHTGRCPQSCSRSQKMKFPVVLQLTVYGQKQLHQSH